MLHQFSNQQQQSSQYRGQMLEHCVPFCPAHWHCIVDFFTEPLKPICHYYIILLSLSTLYIYSDDLHLTLKQLQIVYHCTWFNQTGSSYFLQELFFLILHYQTGMQDTEIRFITEVVCVTMIHVANNTCMHGVEQQSPSTHFRSLLVLSVPFFSGYPVYNSALLLLYVNNAASYAGCN